MSYSDSVSGWSAQYPKDWHVMSAKEILAAENRGAKMLEPNMRKDVPLTSTQLLWLRKDDFNSFTSNYELFDSRDGVYEDVERGVFGMIKSSYTELGLSVDSSVDSLMLDGLSFLRWQATIYAADGKTVIMNQVMCCRLIDNRISLLLNLNYNNPTDRDKLMKVLESSYFSIRN